MSETTKKKKKDKNTFRTKKEVARRAYNEYLYDDKQTLKDNKKFRELLISMVSDGAQRNKFERETENAG